MPSRYDDHGCPRRPYWTAKLRRNAERDRRTSRELRREGWRVLVVWECQTTPSKLESLRRRIVRFLT